MLRQLLAEGRPLLADGATGTNLFEVGLTPGDNPEAWNATHSGRVRALHQSFVDAGADIVLTNSFGGNRRRLALHGLESRSRELNRLAAENARSVVDKAGRSIVVAGSVGPTGDPPWPGGSLGEDEAEEIFVEQIEGLRDGGADVAWIETMAEPMEIQAAASAAIRVGLPYVMTASFERGGKTRTGMSPDFFAKLIGSFEVEPLAFGASCGVGAADLLISILDMTESRPGAAVVAKASAGLPQWHGAHIHYPGTPDLMAIYAGLAIDAGARIVGGCCGTTPAHLAAMRRALDSHRPGPRPDVTRIVAALGPLVARPAAAFAFAAERSREGA
jgi:methionine synthase I (cobalamin-dependent)